MRRGPALFLLFVLLFGAAYGAWRAANMGYERLTHYQPAHAAATQPVLGATPLANRLVVLLIDDLRTDETHLLPSLDWLRQRGAGYRLSLPGPTTSPPVLATLLTSSPPSLHGVLAPGINLPSPTDDVIRAAWRNQVTVGGAGGQDLRSLAGERLEPWYGGSSLAQMAEPIRALLQPGGPRLVFIQVGDLAAIPASADRRDALAQLDTQLVSLFDQIDWKSTAVMVLGSAEETLPLLLAGSGVIAGSGGDASLLDVAPTMAALLGLPAPMAAQGRPILSALQVEGRPLDVLMQTYLVSRQAFANAALSAYGEPAAAGEIPPTAAEAEDYLAGLEAQVDQARLAWSKAGLLERLPYIGGAALLLLLYLFVVYRSPFGRAAFTAHVTYILLFHALFFALGGRYGPGLVDLNRPWTELAYRYGLACAAAMLLAMTVGGFLLSRKEYKRSRYLAASGLHIAFSQVVVIALPPAALVAVMGWDFPVALPAVGLWVWFFLSAGQIILIGALAPVWAWAAVRSARFALKQWPLKEIGNPEVNADRVVRLRALKRADRAPLK